MKGLIGIKESNSVYGLFIGVLIVIIIILTGYIAYTKGADKNTLKGQTTTSTTTTKTLSVAAINETINYDSICQIDAACNKKINTFNFGDGNVDISIETISKDEMYTHNLNITGKLTKTIKLNLLESIKIISSAFIIIKEADADVSEISNLYLYDNKFNLLDKISINKLKDEEYNNLEITYYTFDQNCDLEQENYYMINKALITDIGFSIIKTSKGPLKTDGFVC